MPAFAGHTTVQRGFRDGGGASPAVSVAAGRGRHGGRPLSLRRSRTFALAYRACGRVARRSRLSCPREPGRVFPLCGFARSLRENCRRPCGRPRVAAPVIDKIRIVTLQGYIEEMDFRRNGARFLLRVHSAEGLAPDRTPFRVRLSMRRAPPFEAGTYVSLKARLLPPARASLPGGYDFARDAWFARLGAVGNVLGRIEVVPAPDRVAGTRGLGHDGDRSRPQCAGAPHRHNRWRRFGGDRGGDGNRQARPVVRRSQGGHPRGRNLSHHHDFRRPDDACRGDRCCSRKARK